MKNKIICLLVSVMVLTTIVGCGKAKERDEKRDAIPVKVMKVKLENVNKLLEYMGNITGQDETMVYPKVSGKIIEKVKEDGSAVKKGEVIAYIDRDEVGLKFEKAPVESPIDGMVGRVYVDIGSTVTTQTPVAFVSDIDKAEIDLDVPEKYLPLVSVGQDAEITVDAYPGSKFEGKVMKISPVVDISTRSAPVEISIDNQEHLLESGMFARVKLIINQNTSVPIILREAVMGKMADTYVYVVEGDKAYLKKVVLGIRQGAYYEVEEGIKFGDLVVIMGQQRLRDGADVIVEVDEDTGVER